MAEVEFKTNMNICEDTLLAHALLNKVISEVRSKTPNEIEHVFQRVKANFPLSLNRFASALHAQAINEEGENAEWVACIERAYANVTNGSCITEIVNDE